MNYYNSSSNSLVVYEITWVSLGPHLCVFSHAKIETTGSKGVHCSVSDAWWI